MQQTKLDRWLQSRFVNETLVMTVRKPPLVPKGIKVKDLPKTLNSRFLFQMVIRDRKDLDAVLSELKKLSQTYTTRVRQRSGVAKFFFANDSGKSFSISLLSAILAASGMFFAVVLFPNILIEYAQTYLGPPAKEFKETVVKSWDDAKGMFSDEPSASDDAPEEKPKIRDSSTKPDQSPTPSEQ